MPLQRNSSKLYYSIYSNLYSLDTLQVVKGWSVFETRSGVIRLNEEDVIITPPPFESTKAQFMGLQPAPACLACHPMLFAVNTNNGIINCTVY